MDKKICTKVHKFGGECLRNSENILKTVEIIMSEKCFPIVVISAAEGITDLLIDGIIKSKEKEVNVSETISELTAKHYEIAQESIANNTVLNKTFRNITLLVKKVERLLYGVSYTDEVTEAVRAHIISFGERIAAVVMSGILEDKGVDSTVIETDKIGLVTNKSSSEQYENATVNLEEFKRKFKFTAQTIINGGIIPIMTGFFGSTPDGKVTTFGRNGSDYTASVMAYGFEAKELIIWKDTEAFTSADQKLVREAKVIERLSYYEAAELSYFSDRILHPLTIEPIAGTGIPIVIKNIHTPDAKGTIISSDAYIDENIIKSIAYNKNICMIRIHGTGIGYKPGLMREIGNALSEENINIFATVTSQTTINILLESKDADTSFRILNNIKGGGLIERVDFIRNVVLVAIVGEGLLKRRGIFAKILNAVSLMKVNVEMASAGASEVAIYIIIPNDDLWDVVNVIHNEFFS